MKQKPLITKRKREDSIQMYVEGCIKMDRNSQNALYKHYYSFAMGICLRYANNQLDAAGILNSGFLKAFNNISKYETSKAFLPWLKRIMTNVAIDYYRSNLKFADHVDIQEHENIPHEISVYDKFACNDLLALVYELKHPYRAVFNLFVDGYSHKEIAGRLGITVGTSKSNLFKAKKKLQEMLKAKNITSGR